MRIKSSLRGVQCISKKVSRLERVVNTLASDGIRKPGRVANQCPSVSGGLQALPTGKVESRNLRSKEADTIGVGHMSAVISANKIGEQRSQLDGRAFSEF